MKHFLFLFLFLNTFYAFSQEKTDEDYIKTVMDQQENCWNTGDLVCFMEGYWKSDSLRFVGSTGVTKGWQSTLERYQKSYATPEKMGQLEFGVVSLDFLGDQEALMLGTWKLTRTNEKDLSGYFTLIWRKIDGDWKIIYDHSS